MVETKRVTTANDYTESIIDAVREPLIILNQDLRVVTVRKAFVIEKHSLIITSSIGLSLYPDHGKDVDTMLKTADSAMYQAKQAGRNQYRLYNEAQRCDTTSSTSLNEIIISCA